MFDQENKSLYKQKPKKYMKTHVGRDSNILDSTLYLEVHSKNEICITREQLKEIARLYKDANMKKPGWIRQNFCINQRRRKNLNDVLVDSGLGKDWCGNCCDLADWSGSLHVFWHDVNKVPICL